MKLSTPYVVFSEAAIKAQLVPVMQSDSIYYVKVGSVKVELNCNSGTFKVIAGKVLADLTNALAGTSWKILSRNKGWTVIEIPAGYAVDEFVKLARQVETFTPFKAAKVKAPKVKASSKKTVTMGELMDNAAEAFIKKRNLATIKAVAARLKGDETPDFGAMDEPAERLDLRELGLA